MERDIGSIAYRQRLLVLTFGAWVRHTQQLLGRDQALVVVVQQQLADSSQHRCLKRLRWRVVAARYFARLCRRGFVHWQRTRLRHAMDKLSKLHNRKDFGHWRVMATNSPKFVLRDRYRHYKALKRAVATLRQRSDYRLIGRNLLRLPHAQRCCSGVLQLLSERFRRGRRLSAASGRLNKLKAWRAIGNSCTVFDSNSLME